MHKSSSIVSLCGVILLLCADARADAAHFAAVGDYGDGSNDEAVVAALIQGWQPEFIVTLGDNNYPAGEASTLDAHIGTFYHRYIRFDASYNGAFANDPQAPVTNAFFPALGNHDWYYGDVQPYLDYFALPNNERYYQTRHGPVELFILDSDPHEPDGVTADSVQAEWLRDALAASTAAWKIVVAHHAPYSTGIHGSSAWMRWPFAQWGAHVLLTGHEHDYERIVKDHFPYITCGLGGAELRPFRRPPWIDVEADVRYSAAHGALLIDADERDLVIRFINTDNVVIDAYQRHQGGT